MNPFRLVALYTGRVEKAISSSNHYLSRAQIRRIGAKLLSEQFEIKGVADSGREAWLDGAYSIVDGASEYLFCGQFSSKSEHTLQLKTLAVEMVQATAQTYGSIDRESCSGKEISPEIELLELLKTLCDIDPAVGDRYHNKVQALSEGLEVLSRRVIASQALDRAQGDTCFRTNP